MKLFWFLLLSLVSKSFSHPDDAPTSLCNTTRFSQGFVSQKDGSDFLIVVSKSSVTSGEIITVEIQAKEEKHFRGFYLEAQSKADETQILGEFLKDEEEQALVTFIDCGKKTQSTISYFNNDDSQKISLKWKAPENFQGEINFRVSLIEDLESQWINQLSDDVQVTQSMSLYDGCGKTKTCVGIPDGCIESKDCVSFGAVIVKDGVYSFEMQTSDENAYVSMALSEDAKMGDDSAVECVYNNGEVQAFTSLLGDVPRHSASRSESNQDIIILKETKIENGVFYCLVEHDPVSQIGELIFDLHNEAYYLLLATGTSVTDNGLSYHGRNNHLTSSSPIRFLEEFPVPDNIYDGCGESKHCIGLPEGCIESESCVSFGAVIVKDGVYSFEMQTSDENAYVSMALSEDAKMGDDSAIECVYNNGEVQAFTSLLGDVPRHSASRSDSNQDIIALKESRVENGIFYCLVQRDPVSQIGDFTFDMLTEAYHLMIATGSAVSDAGISYHFGNRAVSTSAIRFTEDISSETTSPPTSPSPPPTTQEPDQKGIYDECALTKSCFGHPEGCIDTKNCAIFTAVLVRGETYLFEMQSPVGAAYVSSALSNDAAMGEDSAIECVSMNGQVEVFASFIKRDPFGTHRENIDQGTFRVQQSKIEAGSIYCLVERDAVTEVEGMAFDLINQAYYVLIASGLEATSSSIGYHGSSRAASRMAIRFEEGNPVIIPSTSNTKTLVLIHGTFMIVAWIGAASIGIFTAKFMKKLWAGKQLFGKDIWFIVHQFVMSLAWALTIAAVVIIIVDVGAWRTSVHSVVGIITTALCFIQPFMAIFRPAPESEARPVFNFIHGSIGKLAHLLAVITIYSSTTLLRADLPSWSKYVVISFIAVYLIFYGGLMILEIISDIRSRRYGISLKEAEIYGAYNASLVSTRQILFILFLMIIVGFVIVSINAVMANK